MCLHMSDDPVLDAERYMMTQEIQLAKRPECHCCGAHIQDDKALHYRAKECDIWLCLECIENNMEYIEVD